MKSLFSKTTADFSAQSRSVSTWVASNLVYGIFRDELGEQFTNAM